MNQIKVNLKLNNFKYLGNIIKFDDEKAIYDERAYTNWVTEMNFFMPNTQNRETV